MKKAFRPIIFGLWILAMFGFIAFSRGTARELEGKNHEIATLSARITELEANPPSGGVEIDLDSVFIPIHPDDFIDFSSPYGIRRSPFTGNLAHHPGMDLFGVWHSRIISPGAGVVVEHWVPPGQAPGYRGHDVLGGCLIVLMDDGHLVTFGHLSETYVHEGDRIEFGDVIGRQGDTGMSDGEHLHFEVSLNGQEVPPFKYLMGIKS